MEFIYLSLFVISVKLLDELVIVLYKPILKTELYLGFDRC